jgi:hypothetical protein
VPERESFIDNPLVPTHFIIKMILVDRPASSTQIDFKTDTILEATQGKILSQSPTDATSGK